MRHTKSTQKDSEAVFANIVEYCPAKEVSQKLADVASKGKGEPSTKGVKTKGTEKEKEEGKDTKDPWA